MEPTASRRRFSHLVEAWAHPLILGAALVLWLAMDRSALALPVALLGTLTVLLVLERLASAQPHWRQSAAEKWTLAGLFFGGLVVFQLVNALYMATLAPPLAQARQALGLDLWPARWPLLAQVALLYFASDFIYYWIHRAIHASAWLWRLSGHGFHHAFHNLHAINAGATHPLEFLFLTLPMVLLSALFGGQQDAMTGAALMLIVNACLAHANVRMNPPLLRWFLTTSVHHQRHHSHVFEDSNTNFGCNAILWDRLFGTYSEGPVAQTGIGPIEPTLLQKLLLPVREPVYADTAASRARPHAD